MAKIFRAKISQVAKMSVAELFLLTKICLGAEMSVAKMSTAHMVFLAKMGTWQKMIGLFGQNVCSQTLYSIQMSVVKMCI